MEQREATLREHAAPGRVYVGSLLNSYQKFIVSIVLGMVPSISLPFPASSQPLQSASWEGMLGIVHLFSGATHHLPQLLKPGSLTNWLPAWLDQWEVLAGEWVVGKLGYFSPSVFTWLGMAGVVIFPAPDTISHVFSSHRNTNSSVARPGRGLRP